MGRILRFLSLLAFAGICTGVAVTAQSTAQTTQSEIYGPTYSLRQMRRIEIEGIHFGMRADEVERVTSARAYRFVNPGGRDGEGHYQSADGRSTILIGYAEHGPRVVDTIMFDRRLTAAELADVGARREELVAMLGRPTHWRRWIKGDGEIGDRLLYLPRRDLADDYDSAWSCYVDWQCEAVISHRDCRPYVSRVRGGTIEAAFGWRSLYIWAYDFSQQSAQLRRDRKFRALDTSGAVCVVMPIH